MKTVLISRVWIIAALLLSALSSAEAATKYVKLPSRGKEARLNLSKEDKGTNRVVFYLAAPGTSTQRFDMSVGSTTAITAKVNYAAISTRKSADSAAQLERGLMALKLRSNYKTVKSVRINADGSSGDTGKDPDPSEPGDPKCGCMTEKQIQEQIAVWRQLGINFTREQLCAGWSDGQTAPLNCSDGLGTTDTTGSDPAGTTYVPEVTASGVIAKNSCSKLNYVVRLEVELNGVTDADFDRGITLTASIKLSDYKGDKAATLKPSSDGGIFPGQPILLITAVNWNMDEHVNVLYWRGTRLAKKSELVRGDTVGISGHFMHRKPIGSILRGGTATIEVVSMADPKGYSHCFSLVRQRQNRGGYHR